MLNLGVTTRSFSGLTNAETAARMHDLGCTCTELCLVQEDSKFWAYNGRVDLAELTDERFADIVRTYRDSGVEVSSIGVFTSLLEPDDAELEKNLEYFRRLMELAAKNGIPAAATECGFVPDSRGVLAQFYESRFERLKTSLERLCGYGEELGVDIALECCVLDVVPSAKRAADLWEQIGSDRLRFLLDPANLIANSSEEDMFYYLSEHISCFHGKDRHVNDAYGRVVGDGDIMWSTFLSLYHEHCDGLPFIIEYSNPENTAEIVRRVREFDALAQKMM